MKTLILTDIHNGWEWAESVIKKESPDRVVFAGDYFDSKDEWGPEASETADWLKGSINIPGRIHLFGNHDVQYAFNYSVLQVSCFEQWKYCQINTFLTQSDWNKLRYYYVLDRTWLITHAGLHPHYIPSEIQALYPDRKSFYKNIKELLDSYIERIPIDLSDESVPSIFNVGHCRKGWAKYGHIIWCDFSREFKPTKGLNQIFGHTPQHVPSVSVLNENGDTDLAVATDIESDEVNNPNCSYNLCLDTRDKCYYAVWDKKSLSIKSK